MKLNLLIYTAALKSKSIQSIGIGTIRHIKEFAKNMRESGIDGDIYDLPNGSRAKSMASPFSLTNGFALNVDELDLSNIPELQSSSKISEEYAVACNQYSSKRNQTKIDYLFARSVCTSILQGCYLSFVAQCTEERKKDFHEFQKQASYWLVEYAVYEVYKEKKIDFSDRSYANLASANASLFIEENNARIEFFKYIQFLCFEQRKGLIRDLLELEIGLVVNLPFGVEPDSADVYFHSDVFDYSLQIGCSPEPQNGYPEQLWGMAAYRERTPALREYLKEKMRWLSQLGTGVFFDHMVGWCGQYVIAKDIVADPSKIFGKFHTENHDARKDNLRWFLDIALGEGLAVRGEVFGDPARLAATVDVMNEYAENGENVSVMRIPWKQFNGEMLVPLSDYRKNDLITYGTHDLETPLQLLCNRKGQDELEASVKGLLSYCNDVLGIPFLDSDLPLSLGAFTPKFAAELMRRMIQGGSCEQLLITYPGLVSVLSTEYRNVSTSNNINVKPGTSGEVNNVNANWSYFSPSIDVLVNDREVSEFARSFGKRIYRPFSKVIRLPVHTSPGITEVRAIGASLANKNVVYKNLSGQWDTWGGRNESIELIGEFVVENRSDVSVVATIIFDAILDLNSDVDVTLDCIADQTLLKIMRRDQLRTGVTIELFPKEYEHFVLYKNVTLTSSAVIAA